MEIGPIGVERYWRTLLFALLCVGLVAPAGNAAADEIGSSVIERSLAPDGAVPAVGDIPVWRTIILGNHSRVTMLRRALGAARCHIGTLAGDVLDSAEFAVSARELQVDLVVVTPKDLGLAGSPSLAEIHARAIQRGLQLSPAEVGPQLRLQYLHQARGEFLHLAMKPVLVRGGRLVAFVIGNGGAGLLLVAEDARADLPIPETVRFVFVRPR